MRTNSLLADFEELEASFNPIKDIEQFIKDNYVIMGSLQISKEPNENGKYIASCNHSASVKNYNITSLTNGMFEWDSVHNFSCVYCRYLVSLEGAPKKVRGGFYCYGCDSLISLEGAPEEVGRSFDCRDCKKLISLEGAPKKVGVDFICIGCSSLTSVEDIISQVGRHIIRRW